MQENNDLFQGVFGESEISQIARSIGANDAETRNAIAAALPALLGGMGRAAESDDGAARLTSQIQGLRGQNTSDIFANLPPSRGSSLDSALGPGNELDRSKQRELEMSERRSAEPRSNGGGMLDDIFGGKQKRVEDAIGKSSGLDLSKIGPLLAILGPIVLSVLRSRAASASRSSGGQIDSNDVRDMLRGERSRMESRQGGGILGSLLDQDGDGDFDFSDIVKLGLSFLMGGRR